MKEIGMDKIIEGKEGSGSVCPCFLIPLGVVQRQMGPLSRPESVPKSK